MNRPAVFLDRDGTLIEDKGYLGDPAQAIFYPGAFEALRRLGDHYLFFIVTNQNGIAKGLITRDDAKRVNDHVVARLAEEGVPIREVYTCIHQRSDGCECIKPKPFFLDKAARDHGVDLKRSFVLGDHPSDVQFAAGRGVRGIFLRSGHGDRHKDEVGVPCEIVPGIVEAATIIALLPSFRVYSTTAYPDVHACLWVTLAVVLAVLTARVKCGHRIWSLGLTCGIAVGLASSAKIFAITACIPVAVILWTGGRNAHNDVSRASSPWNRRRAVMLLSAVLGLGGVLLGEWRGSESGAVWRLRVLWHFPGVPLSRIRRELRRDTPEAYERVEELHRRITGRRHTWSDAS